MVHLYKDPKGEKIFDMSDPTSTLEINKSGSISVRINNFTSSQWQKESEQKIMLLEGKVAQLEAQLRQRNGSILQTTETSLPLLEKGRFERLDSSTSVL